MKVFLAEGTINSVSSLLSITGSTTKGKENFCAYSAISSMISAVPRAPVLAAWGGIILNYSVKLLAYQFSGKGALLRLRTEYSGQ